MHEIGYAESLLPVVEERAAGRKVAAVGVRAGVRHRLVDTSMQQAFDLVGAGSVADGATVELEQVPIQLRCDGCGVEQTSTSEVAWCPACGSDALRCEGGDEFTLHWVRYV